MSDDLVKLNLGSGGVPLPGFIPIDRKNGKEVYPLDYEDNSVDEIYASHILEHFPHSDLTAVLSDWTRKLKPGGRIRIAVPNFEWIAEQYGEKVPIPVMPYVMGGQTDDDDYHKSLFDRETLVEFMCDAGLERLGEWESEIQDCSSLDVSLNIQGFRPISNVQSIEGVYATLSCPRYGPMSHMQCAHGVFAKYGVSYQMGLGAYWSHTLSDMCERLLALPTCRYILTCDYDTIFTAHELIELYRMMEAFPEWDAIVAMQSKRSEDHILFGMLDDNGQPRHGMWAAEMDKHVSPIYTGHFGFTMFRASSLNEFSRPWMTEKPDPNGTYGLGRVDPDIAFWHKWRADGNTLGRANRIVVGHLQEMVTWPGKDLQPIYQYWNDFGSEGIPKEVQR